ncbi:MAG: hypothetical protein WA488_08320, partial [Mycobacterium sp.]
LFTHISQVPQIQWRRDAAPLSGAKDIGAAHDIAPAVGRAQARDPVEGGAGAPTVDGRPE